MTVYNYPHTEVNVYDNSAVTYSANTVTNGMKLLFVVNSPRGIDGKLLPVNSAKELVAKFGMGDLRTYGQPLLNAYAALSTEKVNAEVLRIVAKDSRMANLYVYAAYKFTGTEAETPAAMSVQYLTATDTKMVSKKEIGTRATDLKPALEGYEVVFLFHVCSLGRGVYGNKLGIRISNNSRYDKDNDYKNYYLEVYDGSSRIEDPYTVSFYDNAITTNATLFVDSVINNTKTGSSNVAITTDPSGFNKLVAAYKEKVLSKVTEEIAAAYATSIKLDNVSGAKMLEYMTLDEKNFDPILGINKKLIDRVSSSSYAKIYNLIIEPASSTVPGSANPTELTGMKLQSGSDGAFAGDNAAEAIKRAYLDAFNPSGITSAELAADGTSGDKRAYDETIYSCTRHPIDMIFDANYSNEVKLAIASLVARRKDCFGNLDAGVGFTSKSEPVDRVMKIDTGTTDYLLSVDAWQLNIRDPYSYKIDEVTSTYWLSQAYPILADINNGKHVALAGANGNINLSEMISDSIYPVYDGDLDDTIMKQLANYRINYAQINAKGEVIRATQSTRQDTNTALSEINNVLIVLGVKRDCKALCDSYNYHFLDNTDLSTFNRDAEQIVSNKYSGQVKKITATFSSTDTEQEQGILHLNIELVHKKLIKNAIIDIHINK